jgi:hypothetical protein
VERYRKDAKRLVRAVRAGDAEALARVERALGARGRFVLADAQHVVAVEHGYRSWADLLRAETVEERIVETGLAYGEAEQVRVFVRRRGAKLDIDDGGRAIELAGRPPGWRELGERLVERELWLNVSRQGRVFVPARQGRRVEELTRRVGAASLAFYQELLELQA